MALARALVLEPRLLVADEAVSMLDPSEQAKMIQLLKPEFTGWVRPCSGGR